MSQDQKPSRFTLERYVAGELAGEELARVEAAIQAQPEAQAALAALRSDEETFRAEVPYAAFRIEHEKRMEARRPTRRWALWAPALALFAGAAGLFLFNLAPEDDGTRAKGAEVALTASVQEGGVARSVTSGERVTAGARVQLAYEAGSFTHVGLLGIDAAGAVSVYFSAGGESLAPVPAGSFGLFPFSLTLDDNRGDEQFVAVFANKAASLRAVLASAQALAGLPARSRPQLRLPNGVVQATLWLEKQ